MGFNVVPFNTIQKRIICLIVTYSREYITSIMTEGLVVNGGIDRKKKATTVYEGEIGVAGTHLYTWVKRDK